MGRHDNRKEAMEIVFEDDWLIVVNKPSGLLSVATNKGGSKGPEVTAYSLLMDYMAEQQGRRGGRGRGRDMAGNNSQNLPRIFIVHRLDRDTSGLLVFAKDEDTKLSLQENWNEAVLERKYVAVLEGRIEDSEGWIETWLYENPKSMKVHCYPIDERDIVAARDGRCVFAERNGWKYASTHCLTTLKAVSYTHLTLPTN